MEQLGPDDAEWAVTKTEGILDAAVPPTAKSGGGRLGWRASGRTANEGQQEEGGRGAEQSRYKKPRKMTYLRGKGIEAKR